MIGLTDLAELTSYRATSKFIIFLKVNLGLIASYKVGQKSLAITILWMRGTIIRNNN